jgi:hypothetical protein
MDYAMHVTHVRIVYMSCIWTYVMDMEVDDIELHVVSDMDCLKRYDISKLIFSQIRISKTVKYIRISKTVI